MGRIITKDDVVEEIQVFWSDCPYQKHKRVECGRTLDGRSSSWRYKKQKVYWNNGTFPDATMSVEDAKRLEQATTAAETSVRGMY